MKHKEQSLFGEPTIEEIQPDITKARDAVFNDYESFIAKFNKEAAKTTDDCYTPQDVYEAVVKYVGTLVDMSGRQIIRPFCPGGDYINTNYPPNGIVIDNPPFSIFTKICKFYTTYNIPFFLFGPGLTIGSIFKYCTAVILATDIKFTNGAAVPCNFATNLMGDTIACTAPELNEAIKSAHRSSRASSPCRNTNILTTWPASPPCKQSAIIFTISA